jgi:hypothetical protein
MELFWLRLSIGPCEISHFNMDPERLRPIVKSLRAVDSQIKPLPVAIPISCSFNDCGKSQLRETVQKSKLQPYVFPQRISALCLQSISKSLPTQGPSLKANLLLHVRANSAKTQAPNRLDCAGAAGFRSFRRRKKSFLANYCTMVKLSP